MKSSLLLILPLLLAGCNSPQPAGGVSSGEITFGEVVYEDRPHILVETEKLTYYFDIRGGGFSRIIDNQGNDWVSFKMEPWGDYPASAASSFRGLPNLVFRQNDHGAGHPGHDKCVSQVQGNLINTESVSGLWSWSWEFFQDHAILDVIKTDPDCSYWFLYEGTPGGSFDPENSYVGTSAGGPEPGEYDFFKKEILWGQFQWMYAGTGSAPGTFYMVQVEADTLLDMVSFLGNTREGINSPNGMTVFGFGRGKETNPLLTGPRKFLIGWYPDQIHSRKDHQKLANHIETNYLK
jgi:hypothetical protein